MPEDKLITGNDFKALLDQMGLKIKNVAEYWEIDRNTVSKYISCGDQPMPRNKTMRILVNDLKQQFAK